MKKIASHTLICSLLLIGIACSEKLDPTPLDYTKIISGEKSKTWSLRSISFQNAGDPDWRLTEACWSDDEYIFYRDAVRKFEFKSGGVRCDPSEQKITITDSWSFSNANSTILFVIPLFSDNPIPFTVVDIDSNDMTLQFYFNDAGSQSYQLKFRLEDEE